MRGGTTTCAWARRSVAWACLAVLAAMGAVAPATAMAAPNAPCGTRTGTGLQTYRHVIVIMLENRSFGDVLGPPSSTAAHAAPYLNQLAAACGVATNYRSITHPSHPNYMAVTGGVATTSSSVNAPSIFRQLTRAGGAWRVYEQSMLHNCQRLSAFPYKPGHNPGLAYTPIAPACPQWDENLGALSADTAANALPQYAFIAPDQCHNMHDTCWRGVSAVAAGDAWLHTWVPQLLQTRDYLAGRTVIFITWDEGAHGTASASPGEHCLAPAHLHDISCHVATLVISPYVTRGLRSSVAFSHYSLLQTTERLLGLPVFIGHAGDATTVGMRTAFGF